MNEKEWKYKIKGSKLDVTLTFIMEVLFGGLSLWLYTTNNGAYIFTAIFAFVMLLVLTFTIYRLIFYKVYIDVDGFYYQSDRKNGKYYAYNDIEKAWISSGTAQSGGQEKYCNIARYGENILRFQFFFNDEKAVKYLIKRVEKVKKKNSIVNVNEKEEYLIDGKSFGEIKIIIGVVTLAILFFINFYIIRERGFHFVLILGIIAGFLMCYMVVINYIFFEIKIVKDRFYCRTTPFNGQWYNYSDITHCKEIKKVVRYRQNRHGVLHRKYFYFFEFTDINGNTRKFGFEKEIFEHEINVLKERIEKAQGQ